MRLSQILTLLTFTTGVRLGLSLPTTATETGLEARGDDPRVHRDKTYTILWCKDPKYKTCEFRNGYVGECGAFGAASKDADFDNQVSSFNLNNIDASQYTIFAWADAGCDLHNRKGSYENAYIYASNVDLFASKNDDYKAFNDRISSWMVLGVPGAPIHE